MGTLLRSSPSSGINYLPQFVIMKKYPNVEQELIREIENEIELVRKSSMPIQETIKANLSNIFQIRLKLIKWVIANRVDCILPIVGLIEEFQKAYGRTNNNEEIVFLENAIFALRTAMKIANSILPQHVFPMEALKEINTIHLPYDQLRILIQQLPLSREIQSKLIRFLDTSLSLDFALLLATSLVSGEYESLKFKITEISTLLRNWTQDYGSLVIELGLWRPGIKKIISKKIPSLSAEEIEEQQELAELGIEDYLSGILKEENA